MCGINFIIDKKSQLSDEPIRKMNEALLHRGPDANSYVSYEADDHRAFCGHTRLKIIDLDDRANQPFLSLDKRYILSYNGELYNYRSLRNELGKAYDVVLITTSDTEVLMYTLIKNGMEGLNDLHGMFALTFYDTETGELTVARDPRGIKPVYYYEDDNYLIISSEIKGIFASGLVKKELNEEQIPNYLYYKHVRKPATFYKNIYELQEGKVLHYTNGESTVTSYLRQQEAPSHEEYSDAELTSKIEDLLIESVQDHLMADVPTGLFLSGGVDSTLLLAIIQELGTEKFPVFSFVNEESDKSFGTEDYKYASQAANQYGGELHEFEINSTILIDFEEAISKCDQPIGDSAVLLTYLLAEQARNDVKVVLSGAGADELFAGYNRHKAFYYYLKYLQKVSFLNPLFKTVGSVLPTGAEHALRKEFKLFKNMAMQMEKSPANTFLNFTKLRGFDPSFLKAEYKENTNEFKIENFGEGLHYDRSQYLISDIFALTDKMSMQHGLEARVPYVSHKLTSFVESLPQERLISNGRKWLLKSLLMKRGGNAYCNRQKEGFGLPIGSWIKTHKGKDIVRLVKKSSNVIYQYISRDSVLKMLNEHLNNKEDYSSEIWAIATLAIWAEKEFK